MSFEEVVTMTGALRLPLTLVPLLYVDIDKQSTQLEHKRIQLHKKRKDGTKTYTRITRFQLRNVSVIDRNIT